MSDQRDMATGSWHIDTDLPKEQAQNLLDILERHGLYPNVRVIDESTWHLTLHREGDE